MSEFPNQQPCPQCGKPALERFRPFCSKRCSDVDLHRWLTGKYAIPVEEDDSEGLDDEEGQSGAGQHGRA
jgi:endogenous inhibitor of DNA gyrase (YacG/DUF329 family)